MSTDGVTVVCPKCDEIHFFINECELKELPQPLTNDQGQGIKLNSLNGDNKNYWLINNNKWEINQSHQVLSLMHNNFPKERMDTSRMIYEENTRPHISLKKEKYEGTMEQTLDIKNINIIVEKTGKSFNLCSGAYYMTKDINSAIKMLN